MPGPLPSPKSTASEASPCCSLASPVKLMICTSSPYLAKMPARFPISSGVKVKAVATALPTRTFSAAADGRVSERASAAQAAIAKAKRMVVNLGIIAPLLSLHAAYPHRSLVLLRRAALARTRQYLHDAT